jgi:hypothetical protein
MEEVEGTSYYTDKSFRIIVKTMEEKEKKDKCVVTRVNC